MSPSTISTIAKACLHGTIVRNIRIYAISIYNSTRIALASTRGAHYRSPWHQTRISPARCHLDQALGTGQLLWGHGCYPAQLNIQLSNQAQNLIEINNDVLEISRLISTEMFFIVLIFNYEVTRLTMSAAGALIIKYQFLVGTSHQPHPPPSNLCGRGYVTTVSPATTGYNCFIYLDIDISLCGVDSSNVM